MEISDDKTVFRWAASPMKRVMTCGIGGARSEEKGGRSEEKVGRRAWEDARSEVKDARSRGGEGVSAKGG